MIDDIGTVFAAELARRLRSKPFLIGLVVGVIFVVVFTKLPQIFGNAFEGSNAVVLVGPPAITTAAQPLLSNDFHVNAVLSPKDARTIDKSTLKKYHATAAFIMSTGRDGLHVAVRASDPGSMDPRHINRDLLPLQLQLVTHRSAADVKRISTIPVDVQTVSSKFTSSDQAEAARVVAYTLIFFLYILILLNSQLVMSSVAEEKTSRIAELLVASVDPVALLGGKILAAVTLAVLQMVIWVGAMVLLGGNPTGQSMPASDVSPFGFEHILDVVTPGVAITFLVFFVIGLLQLSTMFAAVASLVNRTEDLGSISTPLIFAVVGALFIAIAALGNPDAPWAVAFSFVPLASAWVMFARIAVGTVPLWQVLLSLGINVLALWGIAILAGKIYRVGMLLYGRTPKFAQIWSVIRS